MTSDDTRTDTIIAALEDAFHDLAENDPVAVRRKYRKMAADPFAFYRGSAAVFYDDVVARDDRWADERTSRVWVQGDLHAENFGTYMNAAGILVFDVNDFDEACLGHFTWDLQRLGASVALLCWTKALPDEAITDLVATLVRAYVDQVQHFVQNDRDREWSLRLGTAAGAVEQALLEAQLSTRTGLLDGLTRVQDHQRQFRTSSTVRALEDDEREAVDRAYREYLGTLPGAARPDDLRFHLKDVVGVTGFGIGSAGLPAYQLLVEGATQALENDVVLSMKQGSVASASRAARDSSTQQAFEHEGHRTAVSQRALQAHADPWLGWARMDGGPHDGVGFVVKELSPYEADLDWSQLTEPDEMAEVLGQLGRAVAKVHCVSDADDDSTPLVDFQTEDAVAAVVEGREQELVDDVVAFSHSYAQQVRRDHALFVDAFRGGRVAGVDPAAS